MQTKSVLQLTASVCLILALSSAFAEAPETTTQNGHLDSNVATSQSAGFVSPLRPLEVPLPESATIAGPFLGIIKDTIKPLSHEAVIERFKSGDFETNQDDIPNFGFIEETIWVATKVVNSSSKPKQYLISIEYPLLDQIEHIELDPNFDTRSDKFGDTFKFSEREVSHRNFVFSRSLAAHSHRIHIFGITTTSANQIPIRLEGFTAHHESLQSYMALQGIYYGAMLVMLIYNIILAISTGAASYWAYVGYVSMMISLQAALHGLGYQYLWSSFPFINSFAVSFSVPGLVFFGGLFASTFLPLREKAPRLARFVEVLTWVSGLLMVISPFLPYQTMIKIGVVASIIGAFAYMTCGILLWYLGAKEAQIYTIAWSTILIGAALIGLSKLGVLPISFLTENGLQVGSLLEVILLSLALADRLKKLTQEKEVLNTRILSQAMQLTEAEAQAKNDAIHRAELQEALRLEAESKLTLFSNAVHHLNNPLNHVQNEYEVSKNILGRHLDDLNQVFQSDPPDPQAEQARSHFENHCNLISASLTQIDESSNRATGALQFLRIISGIDGIPIEEFSFAEISNLYSQNAGPTPIAQKLAESASENSHQVVIGHPALYCHAIEVIVHSITKDGLIVTDLTTTATDTQLFLELGLSSRKDTEPKHVMKSKELVNHLLATYASRVELQENKIVLGLCTSHSLVQSNFRSRDDENRHKTTAVTS